MNLGRQIPSQILLCYRKFGDSMLQQLVNGLILGSVYALIAEGKLVEPAYKAPAGPITPLDILYGHRPAMAQGNLYMAHRCGFVEKVMIATLQAAGFQSIISRRRPHPFYDLWAIASKSARNEAQMRELAGEHFPG